MKRSVGVFRIIVLLLCPLTLVLGHFIGLLRPYPPPVDKDGWINTFFVKKGWFWTSLVMWICMFRYGRLSRRSLLRYLVLTVWWYVFTQALWFHTAPIMDLIFVATGGLCQFDVLDAHGNLNSSFQDSNSRKTRSLVKIHSFLQRFQSTTQDELKGNLASHILATLGRLMGAPNEKIESTEPLVSPSEINIFIHDSIKSVKDIGTSAACRATGGHWKGGHDPSGHIFLNTLMIMFLLGELDFFAPLAWSKLSSKGRGPLSYFITLLNNSPLRDLMQKRPQTIGEKLRVVVLLPASKCVRDLVKFASISARYLVWENPVLLLVAFVILWWYSLVVTTLVFHTISEQLSGLVCAYLVAGGVYWYAIKNNASSQLV
ncbi:hypothetical protein ZYGR_0AF03060 [Zygosaccharomyces rouxii]|uniref:Acyl-coenzyme A diphosphatase SCS3 n=1 Tax=Zygosaccharomyces rouxii TaxID=4956 RepID=A0A1Q3A7W9_ZYGRO|nr:hypothetical protein ZYGR_0AF03060 [Zygosaccharomyces rouxii]